MILDDFWSARPILTHLRDFARARRRNPWAVTDVALVRASCLIPPGTALPPQAGGRASLNLFVALAGPSGAGKGTSESAARDAIEFHWHDGTVVDIPELPLGSGEGIARTFMPPKDDAEQVHTAIFSVPEIDTAAGLFARSGSTIESELRKVFSGEQLGFTNAQAHTRTRVPAHTYRAGLILGVQPKRAGVLLDGQDGGTPQRLVWAPVLDPDMPDERPVEPVRQVVTQPGFSGDLVVPDIARDAIDAHQIAMHRGQVDPLDGHRLLVQLKVAAALMVLDNRDTAAINEEDWHLAGLVMAVSNATRQWVQNERAEATRQQTRARALNRADGDEVVSDRKLQRAKEAIMRWLDRDGHLARHELRRKLKADLRDYFDAAVAELAADGQIAVVKEGSQERYSLTGGGTRVPEVHPLNPQVNGRVPEVHVYQEPEVVTPETPSSLDLDPAPEETPTPPARDRFCARSYCRAPLPVLTVGDLCDEHEGTPEPPAPAPKEPEPPLQVAHSGAYAESRGSTWKTPAAYKAAARGQTKSKSA